MKENHEEHGQEEEDELRSGSGETTATKRKMEDTILLAKQKAQEIAARLVSNASESKRPRLADRDGPDLPEPVPYANSAPNFPPFPVPFVPQTGQYEGSLATNKKISIPTGKVGLIIGKGGETIKYLQSQSGAKIQITKDLEADPHSRLRDVELMGTSEQISTAEQLINDMIAQSETGGGSTPTNQSANSVQPGGETFIMKVPNNKVALIIGKGGESIRTMQARSGARIQIIPLHPPPGDTSSERNVHLDGSPEQVEAAKELISDVISGKRLVNPPANNYPYPPTGNWGAPAQQQSHYGYTQPGGYGQPPPPAPYYSSYPGQGWDPSNQASQQSSGYGYYGQQTQVGSGPPNSSYSYNQNYSQQPPNYGQPNSSDQPQPYDSSGYGTAPPPSNTDGLSSSQSTQPSSAYQYSTHYSQQMGGNPQAGYWSYPTPNTTQPPAQPVYDQTGYYQGGAYGVPQPTHPGYGEDGQQLGHQPQEVVPGTNGFGPVSVNGTQRASDGNSDGNGSASVVQETGDAQCEVGGS